MTKAKVIRAWAIREGRPNGHYWPTGMPLPILFTYKVDAQIKATQLMMECCFPAIVVPIELRESRDSSKGEK